ncbi:hypothetical protein [Xanthomonas vasicola]|uniref:Uncharacterized protein n=1 Tax=Xanthomonas vasicola pv. vasculorum NCPPB 890 TaxID=1184265 RepID=A0A836P5Z7_XANVA|nr:hypothetical protein [Xanthomonas vasicola]KFA39702.1 hypothetical protein KWS_0101640 [Xanthomonas vasicola pv. musacearum NCPPB 4384]AZR28064.1 hypothetical protein NX80_018165 [Xanthomonas vasicola pv. arecae]AZR29713.1 hypothetical protein KWO_003295 [Xanthomonas vasicola pv. musacearum NCPPB 4379]AZR33638.1 hypothetical protein NX08_003170 [Xanthomonas vasicola]KFA09746.1 hypothetical protein KWM_0110330 [Xanthomonas vasicola pv. musacearum NCPPB 2005]
MWVLMMALAVSGCAVENARYTLRDDAGVQAEFHAVASGPQWRAQLALRVHSSHTGLDAWFLPWNGGSDGSQHLASSTDVTAQDGNRRIPMEDRARSAISATSAPTRTIAS